jgi:hypothetical protein
MPPKDKRFYKKRIANNFNPSTTYILADGKEFHRPVSLLLEKVGEILKIKEDRDLSQMNITAVEFSKQAETPTILPNTFSVSPKTHISVDENYLYVWIPQLGRWKRLPISDWP